MHKESAKRIVIGQQIDWARRKKRAITSQGYFTRLEDNLLQPLSDSALNGFGNGGGSELIDTNSRPAKMKALHSSAALAVNFFDYWTSAGVAPLAKAMRFEDVGEKADIRKFEFERQYPTGLGGNPPNLDIAIEFESGFTIAIESKFTEWMTPKSMNKESFRPTYFPPDYGVWRERGLPSCQRLAEAISRGEEYFRWLDVPQLLKHALGLATALSDKFSLHYIYFDSFGSE
ncbi:MAG: hypothetical protein EOP06_20205, partial [Proteobacteria bacterium]